MWLKIKVILNLDVNKYNYVLSTITFLAGIYSNLSC